MRLGWALVLGIVGGIAVAWWLARDAPAQTQQKARQGAESAAPVSKSANAGTLYRWRDARGVLHVTQSPPRDHDYERISADPDGMITVIGAPD